MAKAMLALPQITSLCVYATSFFTRHSIRHYQFQPFVRVVVNRKLGFQHFLKPLVYTVGGCRSISSGVTSNSSGPIDSPLMQSMQSKIKEELNAELVTVNDAYGDGRHVSIDVVSSAFEGKSAVNRQRMVYKAIWEELQNVVHAVDQMTTRTPEEATSGKNSKTL